MDVSRLAFGFGPRSLGYADLDGDGVEDLVAASHEAGTITVLWSSDVGFGASVSTLFVATEIAGVAVADLDADGHLDLATTLPANDSIGVLLGRGDRAFAELQRHRVGRAPRALLVAELDGAVAPELVTANVGDDSITVLTDLSIAKHFEVGPGPGSLAAGDFDGDGALDVAVALAEADALQVLLGDNHGGLSLGPRHPVGTAPQGVVVADFDADGALDLASISAFEDTVTVLRGDDRGGFSARSTWPTIPQASDLLVVSTKDGPLALAILSAATSAIQQLDPISGSALFGTTTPWASALVSGSDGALLYGSEKDSRVGSLVPSTGLRLTPLWRARPMSQGWPLDVEGDGVDELLLIDKLTGPLELWRNGVPSSIALDTGLKFASGARAGELTGDTSRDIIVWDNESVVVLQEEGEDQFMPGPPLTVAGSIIDISLGDADADGRLDVLMLVESETTSLLQWRTSDGDGVLQGGVDFDLLFTPVSFQTVAGAGGPSADLVVTDDEGRVHYMEDFTEPLRRLSFAEAHAFRVAAYGDLDADGALDVVTCGAQGLRMFSDLLAPEPVEPEVLGAAACTGVELTDIDADGTFDLLEYRVDTEGQSIHGRTVLTPWMRDAQGWTPLGSQSMSDTWRFSFAQLDEDQILDLVIIDHERETEARRIDLGPALVETESTVIDTPRRMRVGDVNGDGAADLVGIGDTLSLALADGRGGFGPLQQPLAADLFGDRSIEDVVLVEPAHAAGDTIIVALADSTATELYAVDFAGGVAEGHRISSLPLGVVQLLAADIDGNGAVDLAALTSGSEFSAHVFFRAAQGDFNEPRTSLLATPAPAARLTLYDLDVDGTLDLVGASTAGVLWFRGQARGYFEPGQVWSSVAVDDVVPADLDADGVVELALLRQQVLSILQDDEETKPLLTSVTSVASADLDADGRPELLATSGPVNLAGPTMTLHIGRSDADLGLQFAELLLSAWTVQTIHAADIDGDSNLDLILADDVGVTLMRQVP